MPLSAADGGAREAGAPTEPGGGPAAAGFGEGPGAPGPADGEVLVEVSLAGGTERGDVLGAGWCATEQGGTWTGEAEVGLHLPLRPGTRGCVLELEAAPYRVAHKLGVQRVLVLAAGRLVGRLRFDAPGTAALAIPAEATRGLRVLTLVLVLPDARRPFELDDSEDRRLLGLSVTRVRLLAGGEGGHAGDGGGTGGDGAGIGGGGDGGRGDGGASDGGAREGGAREGGARDGGASDGGASDGGASDGGAREGGARDGGVGDGGSGDGKAGDGAGRSREGVALPAARALLEGFESLGWNEEFGFVQRRVLAEPAGLLRFSSWPQGAAVLAQALDAALYGMGDPAQIGVEAEADSWVATDLRWGLRTQTQVPVHAMDADALRGREAAARAMLRGRLLATLREGRRILVHVARDPGERDAAAALAAAAGCWGGCVVLWVSRGPAVSVRRRGGWLEATLPEPAPEECLARVAESDWLAVCRAAWRLAGAEQAGRSVWELCQAPGSVAGLEQASEESLLFLKKKKQKDFARLGPGLLVGKGALWAKVFWFFFSKKNSPAFLRYAPVGGCAPLPRSRAGPSRSRVSAVDTRATWENACGKLPTRRLAAGSYSSLSRPTSLRRASRRSNRAVACSARPSRA